MLAGLTWLGAGVTVDQAAGTPLQPRQAFNVMAVAVAVGGAVGALERLNRPPMILRPGLDVAHHSPFGGRPRFLVRRDPAALRRDTVRIALDAPQSSRAGRTWPLVAMNMWSTVAGNLVTRQVLMSPDATPPE